MCYAKMPVVQGRLKVSGDVRLDKTQRAHDKTSVCGSPGAEKVLVQSN